MSLRGETSRRAHTYPWHLRAGLHLGLDLSQAPVLLRRLDHHLPFGGFASPALHPAQRVCVSVCQDQVCMAHCSHTAMA